MELRHWALAFSEGRKMVITGFKLAFSFSTS